MQLCLPDNSIDAIVCDPPYELGFMGKAWDASGIANNVDVWRQALRVLKPGGHLLAFSGSRTYHRVTCAIEDAGFEIRDQIMWVYGSGFPKSLDVSKAIDKAAGVEREVVGTRLSEGGRTGKNPYQSADTCLNDGGATVPITAPATDAARQWEGWGTALKPAHEPICVARKPLASLETNVLNMVESQLRAHGVCGEIKWKTESASGAGKPKRQPNSSLIQPQPVAETSAGNAGANVTPSGAQQTLTPSQQPGNDGPSATPAESLSIAAKPESGYDPLSSQPTAESASAAANLNATFSPSTTSTAAEARTGEKSTAKSTHSFGATGSRQAIASYAGIATGLPGSMATVHITRDVDGLFVWPAKLPKSIPGGPLTVAANVLAHGTGALNIDGCRVVDGTETGRPKPTYEANHANAVFGAGMDGGAWENTAGRWPANLITDGSDEVLAEFDGIERRSGAGRRAEDGPSRFFYVAKPSRTERDLGLDGMPTQTVSDGPAVAADNAYQRGKTERRNTHPTVKPLALMQYLVRLVTPPGGRVLDPFTGSGSTWAACVREGFDFVGFELDPHYCEIAKRRAGGA